MEEIKEKSIIYLERSEIQFENDCSLSKIAHKIKVHHYRLSYVLNTKFSKSFSEFINELRIEKAQELLSNKYNNITISSIAFECGYNSLSTFNGAFKKITGTTPSKFRML